MKKYLLVVFTIILFSCSKEDNPDTESITNAYVYFKASLNGKAINYIQTNSLNSAYVSSYYNGFQSGPDYFDRSYSFGCDIRPSNVENRYPEIGMTFSNMYNTNSGVSQTDVFYSLFTTIPTNFITSDQENNLIKGVYFNYSSPNDTYYSTLAGSQVGSSMTVTSSTTGVENGGYLKTITIVGTVSCKLYNEFNPNDKIELTNGTFKLIFRESY